MRCDRCPLCHDEPCGLYDTHAIEDSKDGVSRCNVPWTKIQKINAEDGENYGIMGTDMGISMECDRLGITVQDIVREAKHMVGLDYKEPYRRHGKAYYKPYRNYSEAPDGGNKYLDALPSWCITRRECECFDHSGISVGYKLTREGLDWLGRRLGITIRDEEE